MGFTFYAAVATDSEGVEHQLCVGTLAWCREAANAAWDDWNWTSVRVVSLTPAALDTPDS